MKKYTCLTAIMALVLVFAMLAGCGSAAAESVSAAAGEEASVSAVAEEPAEEEAPAEEPAEEAPAEEASVAEETGSAVEEEPVAEEEAPAGFEPVAYEFPLAEETATLSYFTTLSPNYTAYITDYADNEAVKALEELTNVHIEYSCYIPENAQTQFNLLAASGGLPDLTLGGTEYFSGGMDAAVEEEILVDIGEYLDLAPNYASLLELDEDLSSGVTTQSGMVIGFAAYSDPDLGTDVTGGLMVRGDWLEKCGLEVPTTYDEVTEMLAAFKSEIGCETPMIVSSYLDDQNGAFAMGYDIKAFFMTSPGIQVPFYVVDGQVKCSIVEDDFVDYLTLLRSYMDAGYTATDIESYTNENSYIDIVTSGGTGFFWGYQAGNLDTLNSAVEADGGYIVAVPATRKTADQTLHFGSTVNYQAKSMVNVTANCSDIELAMTWLDAHYTEEVSLLSQYGIEGVSFEYDEEGVPHYTDMMTDASEGVTLSVNQALYTLASCDSVYYGKYNTNRETYTDVQLEAIEVWSSGDSDADYVYPSAASMTAEEQETYTALISDLSTYMAEHVLKFVVGDEQLEDYGAFVDTLFEMGMQDAIDLKQAAYDRYIGA